MNDVILLAIAAFHLLGALATIQTIGKERKPLASSTATYVVAVQAIIIGLLLSVIL